MVKLTCRISWHVCDLPLIANHTLHLSRDPLGIKPLYYVYSGDRVMFSSEAKALCAVMDIFPEVVFSSIDDCLKYRFHPGRETVFPPYNGFCLAKQ